MIWFLSVKASLVIAVSRVVVLGYFLGIGKYPVWGVLLLKCVYFVLDFYLEPPSLSVDSSNHYSGYYYFVPSWYSLAVTSTSLHLFYQ